MSYGDEHIAGNYKILKQTFFKSTRQHYVIHICISICMRVFADVSKEAQTKKKISKFRIISICQRTINIINCAQEGASLITKQGAAKKKMHIYFNIKATRTNGFKIHVFFYKQHFYEQHQAEISKISRKC